MNSIDHGLNEMFNQFVTVAKAIHFPTMILMFVVGVFLRWTAYKMVYKYYCFSREFENRVSNFLTEQSPKKTTQYSFYVLCKKLLEKTFFEISAQREKKGKDEFDRVILADDRIFLTKWGASWFVVNTLKQIRFLQYGSGDPKLMNITRTLLGKNPVFNRLFGVIPLGGLNDFLNMLPGLFVIGGIFGTFLGVMKGLPGLSSMDLNDPATTKTVMDYFLIEVSLSMGASVTGILLSVMMTLVNVAYNPERLYADMTERLENSLDLIWNYATNNEVPSDLKAFDENRSPEEVLAEASVLQEFKKHNGQYEASKESEKTKTA
jgi:hypothetical protein